MIHDYIDFALTQGWGPVHLFGGTLLITIVAAACCMGMLRVMRSHWADWQLRRQARKGTILLVTCDEYLRLHAAEPQAYPLDDETMYALACDSFGHIRMLERSYVALEKTLKDNAERTAMEECNKERQKIQSIMPWYGRRNTI